MNADKVARLAELGLQGDKPSLIEYIKLLAAQSANSKKITLYKKLSSLLDEEQQNNQSNWQVSGQAGIMTKPNDQNLWFPSRLEKRINMITRLLEDKSLPDDLSSRFNKILLYGPPGTGKTTIGLHLSNRLNMPISYVKVSDVISYKFGETLKNISDVFNDPQASLIFIDEFDAFAKSRFDSNDVGELKRIVNSLIQTLDMLPSNKIVIVATNLIETIDPAIARRFPLKLHVSKLNKRERREFIDYLIGRAKIPIDINEKDLQSFEDILHEAGLSTVDSIKGVIDTSFLNAHIEKKKKVTFTDIVSSMLTSGILDSSLLKKIGEEKPALYNKLMGLLSKDFSKSDIADLVGVHRNSLGNYGKEV